MIRGLLEKELRQHGYLLGFLALLLLGGLALISGHGRLERVTGGGFMAVLIMHYTFVPLACLALGQALIATEFRQKTQLFLEGLPLPRWRMLLVKFILGLAVLLAAVGLALGYVAWRSRFSEAMTPRFATVLILKSAGWVWFLYTLCFAHAFLGRYRIIFGVAIFFGIFQLTQSSLDLTGLGPFALMDLRFPYERVLLPAKALAWSVALGFALAALGFALGLIRDATVAALLAEKMSSREKIVMTLLAIVGITFLNQVTETRKLAAPVQLPGSVEVQRGVVRVVASAAVDAPSRAETAALEGIAQRMATALAAAADFLECRSFPAIFIVHRRDLDANQFINGDLKLPQGVLVRANLTAQDFQEAELLAWLLRESLLAQSGGLAGRERNAWVLDGFLWWWPRSEQGTQDGMSETLRAEAAALLPAGFARRELQKWHTLRKKIGEEKARQLAGSGLAVLAQRAGLPKQRRFLAASLGPAKSPDFRGWWHDVRHPVSSSLSAATGWSEAELIEIWRPALAQPEKSQP